MNNMFGAVEERRMDQTVGELRAAAFLGSTDTLNPPPLVGQSHQESSFSPWSHFWPLNPPIFFLIHFIWTHTYAIQV